MKEVSPAPAPAAEAETPVYHCESVAAAPAPAPELAPKPPLFISFHELAMRIDHLGDLPSGSIYLRLKNGIYEPFNTSKIPSDKLLPLIEAGRIYAMWDRRFVTMEEAGPEWPKARAARVRQGAQLRARLRARPVFRTPAPELDGE